MVRAECDPKAAAVPSIAIFLPNADNLGIPLPNIPPSHHPTFAIAPMTLPRRRRSVCLALVRTQACQMQTTRRDVEKNRATITTLIQTRLSAPPLEHVGPCARCNGPRNTDAGHSQSISRPRFTCCSLPCCVHVRFLYICRRAAASLYQTSCICICNSHSSTNLSTYY